MTYKEMSNQLEELLEELQSGDIDLDESIEKYKEAYQIIKKMRKYLAEAENKVNKIKINFEKEI